MGKKSKRKRRSKELQRREKKRIRALLRKKFGGEHGKGQATA